ncbi:hypothetical protein L9F63_002991, partial [Diploptera punctata]
MTSRDGSIWLCLLLTTVIAEVPNSVVRKPNSVSTINATCTADSFSVTVRMRQPFQGLLYARGFPLECRVRGSGDYDVTLHLPASGCGVRVQSNDDGQTLSYVVTVEVQLDRHLQQAADQQRTVTCILPADTSLTHTQPRPSARMARKKTDMPSTDFHQKMSRAWMEIRGTRPGQVSVGEDTTMRIKSWLPGELDSRVTDCSAHDGAGESSQRLLDDQGCPLDEFILPALIKHDNQIASDRSAVRLQVAEATFAAFKFPDRNSLHLRCTLQICRGMCAQERKTALQDNRTTKKTYEEEVLDRLQVFNSVEVLAPVAAVPAHADRAFCLSPPKMALAFGVLGLVFLCAVAVALYTLMRGRRHHYRSKLLLGEETLM